MTTKQIKKQNKSAYKNRKSRSYFRNNLIFYNQRKAEAVTKYAFIL